MGNLLQNNTAWGEGRQFPCLFCTAASHYAMVQYILVHYIYMYIYIHTCTYDIIYNTIVTVTEIKSKTHKTQPIARPHGWAMGCVMWVFWRQLSVFPRRLKCLFNSFAPERCGSNFRSVLLKRSFYELISWVLSVKWFLGKCYRIQMLMISQHWFR